MKKALHKLAECCVLLPSCLGKPHRADLLSARHPVPLATAPGVSVKQLEETYQGAFERSEQVFTQLYGGANTEKLQ